MGSIIHSATRSERNSLVRFIVGMGVVGYGEGVVYLTSPGRPTDIGLQCGKACYPCNR